MRQSDGQLGMNTLETLQLTQVSELQRWHEFHLSDINICLSVQTCYGYWKVNVIKRRNYVLVTEEMGCSLLRWLGHQLSTTLLYLCVLE